MKKIIYLRTDICFLQHIYGGSVGHTLGILHAFYKKGYDIFIFSSQMKKTLYQLYNRNFYQLHSPLFFYFRWKFQYLGWRLESFFSSFFFFLQIVFLVQKWDFSFIYQRYSILNCTGVLLSWYKKIPLILEYNGSEAYWFDIPDTDVWYRRWFRFRWLSYAVEHFNIKNAHTIVVVSQALKDELVLRGLIEQKILVNPNGVNQEYFESIGMTQKRNELRALHSIKDDMFVFGFIGTFGHWHGIELLEYIIPKVCDVNKSIVFFLIGDGSLKMQAEERLYKYVQEGRVIFTGAIDQHQAPEFLSVCDAFVCPTQPNKDGTRFFGSPTKLFEYMSMAKPVIASHLEQLAEVIYPALTTFETNTIIDQVGLIVDPLAWDDWIQACLYCAKLSLQERITLGNNARQKVLDHYTWQKHVEKIIQFIA